MLQRGKPEPESAVTVKLARKQALMGRREVHRTGQFDFGNRVQVLAIITVVQQYATHILNRPNHVGFAVEGLDLFANLVNDPGQGRVIDGVGAFLIGGRKPQGDPPARQVRNDAQAEGGIAVTDPALTNNKFRCIKEPT